MVDFSAKQLLTYPARSLNFAFRSSKGRSAILYSKVSADLSKIREAGNKYAKEHTEGISEVSSIALCGEVRIKFNIDEILKLNGRYYATEHKQPPDSTSSISTYLQISLLQTALYGALAERTLMPFIYWKDGKQDFLLVNRTRLVHTLNFGGTRYRINVTEPDPLIRFFFTKARASFSYEKSGRFDEIYKHCYKDLLMNCFKYRKLYDKAVVTADNRASFFPIGSEGR